MSEGSRIGIAILAAGESTRMGSVKQLLPWKKTTLLGHAIEIAELTEVQTIAVVLGANFELISEALASVAQAPNRSIKITILHNHRYAEGQGTSVAKAAEWAKEQGLRGIVFMLADQPKLSPEILHQILPNTPTESANEPRRLTAARYGGSLGVPAYFGEAYFDELIALEGEKGAKSLLLKYANSLTEVQVPEAELDLDTEAEYKLALRQT
jgi:molybdenum cofactor cytidylyltransferase